jgi:hypothetical protein
VIEEPRFVPLTSSFRWCVLVLGSLQYFEEPISCIAAKHATCKMVGNPMAIQVRGGMVCACYLQTRLSKSEHPFTPNMPRT